MTRHKPRQSTITASYARNGGTASTLTESKRQLIYTLAERLAAPGWDTFGEGDFPGIDGLEVTEWDVDRHTIEVAGYLTPETAPALPWPPNVVRMNLRNPNTHGRSLAVETESSTFTVYDDESEWALDRRIFGALDEALRDAIHAGVAEYEYMYSEDALREDIEANGREFLADGRLA
jgi:hypothetical protein